MLKIIRVAVYSRLLVIAIQFVSNHLISDHDAGVFISPIDNATQQQSFRRPLDGFVDIVLGGFRRWDAQYFLHIAQHGYTYENTIAFYPLFPVVLNVIARILHAFCGLHALLSFRELLLLVAILVNIVSFALATRALYRLTQQVYKNDRLANHAALLFAFNPASIFFTAPYTESIFAWLTFSTMELCERKRYTRAVLPLCLSIMCRSNGTINCGLFVFHALRDVFSLPDIWKHLLRMMFALSAAAITFGAIQYYQYSVFCVDAIHNEISTAHRAYGQQHRIVLAGEFSKWNSSWCYDAWPQPYTYVQKHYWNVGLFAYYEPKQIPNFALAAPILWIFLRAVFTFCRRQMREIIKNPLHLYHLFRRSRTDDQRLFVYVVHSAVLTLICLCFVHIQVSTRLLCSASPCLYWFCALRWDGNSIQLRKFVRQNRWLSAWFGGYLVIGTILFSNFLPWT